MFPTKFRDVSRIWESSPQVVSDTRSEVITTAGRITGPMTPVNKYSAVMQMHSQRAVTTTFKSAKGCFASLKSEENTSITAAAAALKGFSGGSVDTPSSFNHPNIEEYNKKFDDAQKEWTARVNLTPAQEDAEADSLYALFPFYRTREDKVRRRMKVEAGKLRRRIGTHVQRELKTLAAEQRREMAKKGGSTKSNKAIDLEDSVMKSARSDKRDDFSPTSIGKTAATTSSAASSFASNLIKSGSEVFPPVLVAITADTAGKYLPSFGWRFGTGEEAIIVFDPRSTVADEHGTGTIKALKRKALAPEPETTQKRVRVTFEVRPTHHVPATSTNPPEMISPTTVFTSDEIPVTSEDSLKVLSIGKEDRVLKPLVTKKQGDHQPILRRSARLTKKSINLRVGKNQKGPHRLKY